MFPVRVVKLIDAAAIEAQVVENLQREDIHSLEESLGFKSLSQLGEPTYSLASVAAESATKRTKRKSKAKSKARNEAAASG